MATQHGLAGYFRRFPDTMRIAIVTSYSRKAGGAEGYLDRVIGELRAAGHHIALLAEFDAPADRAPIRVPADGPAWCATTLGWEAALKSLRDWRADIVFSQGLDDPAREAQAIEMAPAVFFAHAYRGCCISGAKSFAFPKLRPCSRRLGSACLFHFYPHRCGGLSPLTALSDFRRESQRLRLLRSYRAIVTASEYMRTEYLRNGFGPEAVTVIPYPAHSSDMAQPTRVSAHQWAEADQSDGSASSSAYGSAGGRGPYRLLFAGRMEPLKGAAMMLDSLPRLAASIERGIHLTLVGDGRERAKLEKQACHMQSDPERLRIRFAGWLDSMQLKQAFQQSDLLVVPSLWPEPFGLVGPEAGLESLPAAAFAVGGIPEWLLDGINGYLAPADPPMPERLAQAIVKCLSDPETHARLRRGALQVAQRFTVKNHTNQLIRLLDRFAGAPSTDGKFTVRKATTV